MYTLVPGASREPAGTTCLPLRSEREPGEFERGNTKWDADDCEAEQDSAQEMRQRQPEAGEHEPDRVAKTGQTCVAVNRLPPRLSQRDGSNASPPRDGR